MACHRRDARSLRQATRPGGCAAQRADPAADADGVTQKGNRDASMGRCGPRGRAAEICDSKTGARCISLAPTALAVLDGIEPVPGNSWVFAGIKLGAHVSDLTGFRHRRRKKMGLQDVRLHDLRHSYASRALSLGDGLPKIGKLLGHTRVQTTARYAHLAVDSARVAACIGSDLLQIDRSAQRK